MTKILRVSELIGPNQVSRTATFIGRDQGAGASFFYVDNDPGQGPGLHWHPYSETWLVLEGTATFRLGDGEGDAPDTHIEEVDATADDILTVPPLRHHAFVNAGPGRLRMLCLHASPEIIQFDLE